jgi:hypothetical protein
MGHAIQEALNTADIEDSTGRHTLENWWCFSYTVADSKLDIHTDRWLIWAGAWKAGRREDAQVDACMAKLFSSTV